MADKESKSGMFTVTIDEQEKNLLLQLLEPALSEARVEVRRTHTPDFREQVQHREELIRRLIAKFGQANP